MTVLPDRLDDLAVQVRESSDSSSIMTVRVTAAVSAPDATLFVGVAEREPACSFAEAMPMESNIRWLTVGGADDEILSKHIADFERDMGDAIAAGSRYLSPSAPTSTSAIPSKVGIPSCRDMKDPMTAAEVTQRIAEFIRFNRSEDSASNSPIMSEDVLHTPPPCNTAPGSINFVGLDPARGEDGVGRLIFSSTCNNDREETIALLESAAAEAAEKSASVSIFDGDRVKYGFLARQLRKLIEEIGEL
jgi:hypothetical protein